MGRKGKSVREVLQDYEGDFSLVDDSLLLCKYCKTVVNWKKRTRIQEHMATKMHQDRKRKMARKDGDDGSSPPEFVDLLDQNEDGGGEAAAEATEMASSQQQQQYCLRWNNHQNNLLKVFARLLGSEQFTDVLLAAEGCTIRAHKVVLSACSSYFENLFTTFDERNQIVILKDTSFSDATAIVEFMYRGEINVAQDQLASLLKTAENLKVKGLAEVTSSSSPAATADFSAFPTTSFVPPAAPQPRSSSNSSSKRAAHAVDSTGGGEVKRKRGRPRTLDSPGEIPDPCFTPSSSSGIRIDSVTSTSSRKQQQLLHLPPPVPPPPPSSDPDVELEIDPPIPTPGGPLTSDRIGELGIVKMNDYLNGGTRQQFWEEFFVKVIMQAVRNKEIDMKTSAELLGVSYGTLYGRYRETFGYLKSGWNVGGGVVASSSSSSSSVGKKISATSVLGAVPVMVGNANANLEQVKILNQIKEENVDLNQANSLLGMDSAMLAYQMALKCSSGAADDDEEEDPLSDGGGAGEDEKDLGQEDDAEEQDGNAATDAKDKKEADCPAATAQTVFPGGAVATSS